MALRPRLVGEAPAPTDDPTDGNAPLTGRPARVLISCLGWETEDPGRDLTDYFETVNLFPERPDPWDRYRAAEAAARLGLAPVTLLLGRRVAEAFRLGRLSYFRWTETDGCMVICIPHPSGLNRLYNSPSVREEVGAALRYAIGSVHA